MPARRAAFAAILACAMVATAASPAPAAQRFRPRVGGALGLAPPAGTDDFAAGQPEPAVYHGGTVMHNGANPIRIHLVFWAPSGFQFHSNYKAALSQFGTDVQHDNGSTSNVFSVLPQYRDAGGALPYNLTFDVIDDADAFPTSDNCA